MIRTQIYIPDELYAQAKLHAKLHGMNISEMVREGLRQYINTTQTKMPLKRKAKTKDPLADLVGKYKFDKVTHIALNHNDIYD